MPDPNMTRIDRVAERKQHVLNRVATLRSETAASRVAAHRVNLTDQGYCAHRVAGCRKPAL